MNIFPTNPNNGIANVGAGVEQVRSLSQIVSTQLAQASQFGVAGAISSAAVPSNATTASIDPPCLEEVYQWALANQARMTGGQVPAMMDELVNQLKGVKNADGSAFIQSDADLMNAVGVLTKKFASDGSPQSAFWNNLQTNLFAVSTLMIDMVQRAFFDEVKVYGEPE